MTIDELIKNINALMNHTELDTSIIDAIAQIQKGAESLQASIEKKDQEFIDLKQKYINNLRNGFVSNEHSEEANQAPKSFEDCINEVIKNRK